MVGLAALAVLLLLGIWMGPPLWRLPASLALARDLYRTTGKPSPTAPSPADTSVRWGTTVLDADLYAPPHPAGSGRRSPALLLVHGLTPQGKAHPRLKSLAQALAGAGFLVLVPDFPGLKKNSVRADDAEAVIRGLRSLMDNPAVDPGRVGLVGLSFGAGPALLAASEPEMAARLRFVGSFGGYWDLPAVIRFIATGTHDYGGRTFRQPAEPYNRWKLLALLAAALPPGAEREALESVARVRLANPGALAPIPSLGPEGQAIVELATAQSPEQVGQAMERLPPSLREELDRLSPRSFASRIKMPLIIGHGKNDDSIPFTESLKLADAVRHRVPVRLAVLEGFGHTQDRGSLGWWGALTARGRTVWGFYRLVDALVAQAG